MEEPTNETRSLRARRALVAYVGPQEMHRLEGDLADLWSWDEAIRDLVTDLGHLYVDEVSHYQVVPKPDPVNDYKSAVGRAARAFGAEVLDADPA